MGILTGMGSALALVLRPGQMRMHHRQSMSVSDMLKHMHPESDDVVILTEVDESNQSITFRRVGTVTKHLGMDDVPEQVRNLIARARSFREKHMNAAETANEISRKLNDTRANCEATSKTIQSTIRSAAGLHRNQLIGVNDLSVAEGSREILRPNDIGLEVYVSEEEHWAIMELQSQLASLKAEIKRLEIDKNNAINEAQSLHEAEVAIARLAAMRTVQHLEGLGNSVNDVRIAIEGESVVVVTFEVNRVMTTYELGILPGTFKDRLRDPMIRLDNVPAKAAQPAEQSQEAVGAGSN